MQILFQKYNRQISALILIGYLSLSAVSVFHYHHIILNSKSFYTESEKENKADITFSGTLCSIILNYNSLYNIKFSDSYNFKADVVRDFILFEDNNFLPSQRFFNSNGLRAPPELL